MNRSRTLLFLQGPPSPFWPELAAAFEAAGHRTLKINFCFGDWLYWRRRGAHAFRGRFSEWKRHLREFVTAQGVTDILYYADRLPYHAVARELALEIGIPSYVMENGYLRPDWITLERGGMGAYSHFPDDPRKIATIASKVGEPDLTSRYPTPFAVEMFHEITFHTLTYALRPLFPRYRADRYYNPFTDYVVGALRLFRLPALVREAERLTKRLLDERVPFYLMPLQLQGDYQIRDNSPFRHLGEAIKRVIASFAAHAAPPSRLLFKIHPYDNGYESWAQLVRRIAETYEVIDRVDVIDGGNLRRILKAARGTITVNSTAGLQSICEGCPTMTLGTAVYDMPGLTHQGTLDSFFQAPDPVDRELSQAFVRALAVATQVNGSFFNRRGRAVAIPEIVARIIDDNVNQPDAFEMPPPRLAELHKINSPA